MHDVGMIAYVCSLERVGHFEAQAPQVQPLILWHCPQMEGSAAVLATNVEGKGSEPIVQSLLSFNMYL